MKKVKYAYEEWPHSADTASPHSQKVERRREYGYSIINMYQSDTTVFLQVSFIDIM
jgi:hypothetical protein